MDSAEFAPVGGRRSTKGNHICLDRIDLEGDATSLKGIGETEQDEGDADDRRLREPGPEEEKSADEPAETSTPGEFRQSRDPTGQCSNTLDLSG